MKLRWSLLPLLVVLGACEACDDPPVGDDDDSASVDDDDAVAADCEGQEDRRVQGVDLVLLCPATFQMGCTPGMGECQDQERPVHDVTLTKGFFIGRTEVTQAQFLALMDYNPSDFQSCGPDCPVEFVSWHESAAFANAMSAAEGLDACYACTGEDERVVCEPTGAPVDCDGYRLATEAEWEFAARGGQDFIHAGSATLDDVAWFAGNSGEPTRSVGKKQPNGYGLYDMSGNVWEWVHDWHAPWPEGDATDPAGPATGDARMSRGGSVFLTPSFSRISYRIGLAPEHLAAHAGFRVVRTFDGSAHPGELGPPVGGDWEQREWCTNGFDDDGDGDRDCADSECDGYALCEPELDCFDGIDNDGDGDQDCADEDCVVRLWCAHETDCTDGIDNDDNEMTDCWDPICWADAACGPEREICDNGFDDDHDFLLDCEDASCEGDPACAR